MHQLVGLALLTDLKSNIGRCHALDKSMVLLNDVIEVLDLTYNFSITVQFYFPATKNKFTGQVRVYKTG